jgi:hypothetical protein
VRLPQRLLAIELRTEVDRARRRPWDSNALRRALGLAQDNPQGLRSEHVRHNVGVARLAWLARAQARAGQVVTTEPLVGQGGHDEGEP